MLLVLLFRHELLELGGLSTSATPMTEWQQRTSDGSLSLILHNHPVDKPSSATYSRGDVYHLTLHFGGLVEQTGLVVQGLVDLLNRSGDRGKLQNNYVPVRALEAASNKLTMSEAAFTLSTAPIWSTKRWSHVTAMAPKSS